MQRERHLVKVRDFMSRNPRVLTPDLPIEVALDLLDALAWSGAPVVDADGALLGVFTEFDGIRVIAEASFHDTPTGTVAQHMTTEVVTISPDADVYAVASLFRDRRIRRLPVVERGVLVGMVAAHDVGRALRIIHRERETIRRASLTGLLAAR